MPRGDWRVFAAIAGLILAGVQQPAKQAQAASGTNQQQAASTRTTAPSPSAEPSYRPYPNRYADACYNTKSHDSADLCAQWRAAVAAEKTAQESRRATSWGIAGVFLTFATLVGLIITVMQTQGALGEARRGNRIAMKANARSTRQAMESAKESREATEAMRESNQIAKIEKRPWLTIEVEITEARYEDDRLLLRYAIKITNIGQMVAERSAARAGIVERDDSPNGVRQIEGYRAAATRIASITEFGPQMPYPIIPRETKTTHGEIEILGDIRGIESADGSERTSHTIFVCARYHVPGETIMRETDRAFRIDYGTDPNNPFKEWGIPIPIPSDLSPDKIILRQQGHNRTT